MLLLPGHGDEEIAGIPFCYVNYVPFLPNFFTSSRNTTFIVSLVFLLLLFQNLQEPGAGPFYINIFQLGCCNGKVSPAPIFSMIR